MSGPHGKVPTLGYGSGVMHGATLVGTSGRLILELIVGCVGVMASPKIAVDLVQPKRYTISTHALI